MHLRQNASYAAQAVELFIVINDGNSLGFLVKRLNGFWPKVAKQRMWVNFSTAFPRSLSSWNVLMYESITSYLVRRAVCGLTTKNYNKMFVQQLKKLAATELTPETLRTALASLDGDASRWPGDEEFRRAWLGEEIYPGRLDAGRSSKMAFQISGDETRDR